ncbi:hypothetical protein MX659_01375 [Coriobacteriia bacterium Es71-Z0120]|uniref:hypothetical protein n=1 Tax=Parvivirga hydrogeniphila TaxID=2939460 RepID=UPI002260FB47|nr:hypothetical protein [Parvivirga hydrogeniphila]MCL4078262.1 hypothetical protein [Parvivirga hydrogeniphila]
MARNNRLFGKLPGRVLAAVLAFLVVSAFAVPSWALLTVLLHSAHVGASSETFAWGSGNGGLSDQVVWHFVLNGMDRSTPEAQLTVTFQSAGTKTVTARNDGQTQHFYVGTPGHDVLVSGFAVAATTQVNNLVLSHVWYDRSEEPGDPGDGDTGEEPGDPGDGEEPGDPGDGDTGEEPGDPGDGDTGEEPGDPGDGEEPGDPGDGDTGEEPGDPGDGEEPGDPGDGDTGEEDFLPFTEQQPGNENEDFLPFTGGEIALLLAAAGAAALSGAGLRRRQKSGR